MKKQTLSKQSTSHPQNKKKNASKSHSKKGFKPSKPSSAGSVPVKSFNSPKVELKEKKTPFQPTKKGSKRPAVILKKSSQKAVQTLKTVQKTVKKQVNIPNVLTLLRIWAIPLIVVTFFFDSLFWAWLGVILFAAAGITDYMDGYLARHLNQLSRFGRVLDPIADKLLVGATLIMLAYSGRLGYWGIIPAVIILCREILVSGLREFLAEIKVGCPVTRLAKWKTACQMTALPVLILAGGNEVGSYFFLFLKCIGSIALWGAAILTVMTGYDYWKSGVKYMNED